MAHWPVPFHARQRRALTLAAGTAAAALCALSPSASAQPFLSFGYEVYRERPYVLERPYVIERPYRQERERAPALDVRAMLNDDGYRVVGRIQRKGPVYLADVIDLRGRSARLIIDAEDGEILERYDGADAPRPPRDIANADASRRTIEPLREARPAPDGTSERRAIAPKPTVAAREPAKIEPAIKPEVSPRPAPAKPKTPEKKPLPSEAMKPPVQPQTPAASAPAPAAPAPVAAARPKPRVIAPELTGPPPSAAADVPAAPDPKGPGFANGVPVNPLD